MTDTQHVISIILHGIQALAVIAFLLVMWKWWKKPKRITISKEQESAIVAELERQYRLRKKHIEILKNTSMLGR